MSTRHLLDPDLATAVDKIPVLPLDMESLDARRAARAELMAVLLPKLPGIPRVTVSERLVPGPERAPAVRLLVHSSDQHASDQHGSDEAGRPVPALLWIHGGGYVDGRADWDSHLAKVLVRETGCCVICVDYRLAPESPFPAAVEDCYAALRWIFSSASELHLDAGRIGVAGISAGGGLAASLALMARDKAEFRLAFQVLLQPMLDDRHAAPGYRHPYAGEFIWTSDDNRFGWSALLGHDPGIEGVSPYASAARAESLEGLPPSFISVGSLDLFVEESIEYARRLIRDGVPAELHVHPGACHGFQFIAPRSSQAQVHDYNYIAALRRAMAPSA